MVCTPYCGFAKVVYVLWFWEASVWVLALLQLDQGAGINNRDGRRHKQQPRHSAIPGEQTLAPSWTIRG